MHGFFRFCKVISVFSSPPFGQGPPPTKRRPPRSGAGIRGWARQNLLVCSALGTPTLHSTCRHVPWQAGLQGSALKGREHCGHYVCSQKRMLDCRTMIILDVMAAGSLLSTDTSYHRALGASPIFKKAFNASHPYSTGF